MSSPRIESYRFGRIVIDGHPYSKDLLILPTGVIPNWRRTHGHEVNPLDLKLVLDAAPELLVIGSGAHGRMQVQTATFEILKKSGIDVRVQKTPQACELFNAERLGTRTAAALHLTC
jgi:hypothetical protein